MADPKIKYDIEANVTGNAEVGQLATKIEQLAGTLDGELKASALTSAEALRQLAQKEGAIQNFVDLKREAQQAATGLQDTQAAAQKLGAELAAVQTPTRAQAGQLQKLRDAVRDAKAEVVAKNAALMQARGGLEQYGISTDNLSQSQRNIKTAISAARTEVTAMAPAWQSAAAGASSSANQQVQAAQKIESGLESLKNQLATLRNIAVSALGGSYVGSLAKDVAETADAYNNLQARIKLVTGEGAAFQAAFDGVTAVAQRTNTSLESTGNLFAKILESGKALGMGQAAALSLTETVNKAIQLSGASAQASEAAVTQLIQGLQGGVLRGDEFNSVMEQSPRLAKALADGLSVTTGELRKMAEAGQLSSETVIKALQGQADVVASEFNKLPPTVGRAIQNLSTSWTLYVGETDKATGASSAAASAINLLAGNLKTVAGFLLDAGQAAAGFVAIKLAQHFLGIGAAAAQATTAVVANTAAVNAASTASGAAAVNVGRFAAILSSLKLLSLVGIVTNFHDIGTAIGEAAAKLMGYKDRTEELARADKVAAEIAAESAAMRKRMADATQAAIDKQFELSKSAVASIAEFDKLTKEGASAADAIAKIGKDFDLATVPGIRDASAVLSKLAADGKISAGQFQAAWGDALKGADLAVFEVQARAAFAGTAREAERLGQVLDVSLRESIKRTGLDFDVISGGMGKASRSAINDTEAMITRLGKLKTMGVDTAQVLAASIGKGISTADSQKAIEAVKTQIEAVRKVLGDKVADGLLDQAKQKALDLKDALDKATPGINSVREAMQLLGVTSDQTFKDTAEKSKAAYDAMKISGTSSARELADGFKKMAADQIAASGEVGSTQRTVTEAVLKSEGAVRGLTVAFDAAGKMSVQTNAEAAAAIQKTTGALGGQRDAIDSVTSALERQNAAQERANAAIEKAAELERKRLNMDKEGFSTDKSGNRIGAGGDLTTLTGIASFLKSAGVNDDAKARSLAREFADSNGNVTYMENPGQKKYGGDTISMALLKAAETYTFGIGNAGTGQQPSTIPEQAKAYTVNVNIGGATTAIKTSSDADAQALIRLLQNSKLSSGL
jgi:tape measure domain-containing protein